MSFSPNMVGQIWRKTGRDVRGQPSYADPVDFDFAVVNAKRKTEKTSVRADSSGSRGAAEQVTTDLGRILLPTYEAVGIDDKIAFDDDTYRVVTIHRRRDVFGALDHIECDIEVLPR